MLRSSICLDPILLFSREEIMSILDADADNLIHCPSCFGFIAKDGGCHYRWCVCGKEFDFAKARWELDNTYIYTNLFR